MNEKELSEDFDEILWEAGLFEGALGDRALILNKDEDCGVKENNDHVEMNNEVVHKGLADKYLGSSSGHF